MTARVVVAALMLIAPGLAAAQEAGGLKADLLRDWTAQKARIVALAEAMPADKYDFKATPEQRTFGEQLGHLAQAHVSMFKRLDTGGAVASPQPPAGHARDETVKFVAEAYDYGEAVLKSLSDSALATPGERGTPARTVWNAMNNASNHYGQTVVYLRLNGIVPPASRR